MRLCMFTTPGSEDPRLGALTSTDWIIDLAVADEIYAETDALRVTGTARALSGIRALLEAGDGVIAHAVKLVELADSGAELPAKARAAVRPIQWHRDDVHLHDPIPDPEKFIGIGLNYRDHAEEQGARIPRAPIVFAKFRNSLIGPYEDIRYPTSSDQLDYEAELGVVIGRPGRDISASAALDHVAGYCVVNDVTARDVQLTDRQWVRGKTFDALTPVGPWLTTPDEAGDVTNLSVRLWLNGTLLQDSSTSNLIFGVPEIISHVSQDITLAPGDIIATGTPGGVGFVREPAVFMHPGDRVEVEIENLGRISNTVRAD